MGAKAKTDGRSRFKGHAAPVVAGGRRMVATYIEETEYAALTALAERRDQSVSSLVAAAIRTAVKRAR